MQKDEIITKENIKENYDFLAKKVLDDRAKNYSPFILSFRNEIIRQHFQISPIDMFNLDLLYFEALKIDSKPYLGREALNEAYSLINKLQLSQEDKYSYYKNLGMDYQEVEDVRKELKCLNEASFAACKIGRIDEAFSLKKDVIALSFRFEEEERKEVAPTYEELILQFGPIKGKELYAYLEEGPSVIYDTVESNPFYVRLIDKVNAKIHDYFEANPNELSEQKYNSLKRKYLKEEGLIWNPPYTYLGNNKA